MSLTINQKGLNATLGRWKNDRCSPLFAIYQNRTCICQNVENDFDKATEKLENFFADIALAILFDIIPNFLAS
jgi:hypothetical protein